MIKSDFFDYIQTLSILLIAVNLEKEKYLKFALTILMLIIWIVEILK